MTGQAADDTTKPTPERPLIAFYAPMKPPDHPTPSGDRQIARLTLRALDLAGFRPFVACRLRTLDKTGDAAVQADLAAKARAEIARLPALTPKPALWFTYHCHYKAPDLIGAAVAEALQIPYAISEPSISPRRRKGPWASFAAASEAAIDRADALFWTTQRDRPALEAAGHGPRMVHLPAFLDAGPPPAARHAATPVRLLAVAMMRQGDKLESYRRLAAALAHLPAPWHLDVIGDGPARAEVEALFTRRPVSFLGATDDADRLRAAYRDADLLVWPGIGEGVGMTYLEAQAAGCPVVAEDHPAQRDVVANRLAPPGDPQAFAALIADSAADRARLAHGARAKIDRDHGLGAAATRLHAALTPLIGARR